MGDDDRRGHSLVARNGAELPSADSLQFGDHNAIDLSKFPDHQANALREKHALSMIELEKKRKEALIDVGALDANLGNMTTHTRAAVETGAAITITHSQTSTIGRTEVIMGNTSEANKGKLSASAKGQADRTLIYICILAATAVVAALILSKGL